jgi:hypothetical protein
MRRIPFVLAAVVLVASCKGTPGEQVTAHDAAAAPSSVSAEAAASSAADAAPAGEARNAGEEDAGRAAERAFCTDVYGADLDRMREKCSPQDFSFTQAMSRSAANLCFSDLAQGLARARATFDPEAARKCVDMLRQKELTKSSESDSLFMHFPCDRVLLGVQAEGQPCRFSIECKDGLACVGYAIGKDGTCKKPPKATEACTPQPFGTILTEAAASMHHPACAPGAYCDGTTCQPRVAAGKACGKSDVCALGLSCVVGKCGQRGQAGAACVASGDCAFGLWCERAGDAGPGKCSAKKPEGQECLAQDACKGRCELPKGPDGKVTGPGKCASVCGSG